LKEHASEGWLVISMPALAEENEGWRDEGEPLWKEKFPLDVLERIREAVGSAAWTSLYQQRPAPEQGAIFQRGWWRSYAGPIECHRTVFSLDTAFKTGLSNDYSVVAIVSEAANGYYVRHVSRGRWDFPDLKRQAIELADIWKPHAVLIEDAASGQSLIQALKAETRLPILPVKPLGDKQSRAHAVSPLVESGRVFLPAEAPWLDDFLDEVTSFPAAPHDDMVDALTQGLGYLRGKGYQPVEYFGAAEFRSLPPAPWRRDTSNLGKQQKIDLAEDAASARGFRIARGRWDGHFI
jgi:predicted phage terminase large subunit-like protein